MDAILDLRLSPFRAALAERALMAANPEQGHISQGEFDRFISSVRRVLPQPARFDREVENVRAALAEGKAPQEPSIGHPETQLLWGAALLLIHANQKEFNERWSGRPLEYPSVVNTPLWEQVTQTGYALEELSRHAFAINESRRDSDAGFNWGAPGTTFFFDHDNNTINIDFVTGLVLGMEHTRAISLHETGHSQMSVKTPQRQRDIQAEMKPLQEKIQKGEELPDEDYKRLRMLAAEWEFRHQLTDAAENNCVNRNAEVMGGVLGQDFGYSLNHNITLLSDEGRSAAAQRGQKRQDELLKDIFNRTVGDMDALADEMLKNAGAEINDETRRQMRELLEAQRGIMEDMLAQQRQEMESGQPPRQKKPKPHELFMNTIRAVGMAFYQNNGLIENTQEEWEKIGIHTEWIRAEKPDGSPVNDNHDGSWPHPDFAQILDLCSGPQGLENLRPTLRDHWYGRDHFGTVAERMCDRRNEIIDKIWDLYLDRYAKEMMKKVERQVEKELEQDKDGQDQQQQEQQEQQGQGQGQGQGKSQKQKGRKQQQKEQGRGGQEQQGQEEQQEQGQDQDQGQGEGEQGQGQEQQESEDGDFDPSQAGVNKDGKKIKVKNGEKTSEMPDVVRPPDPSEQDGPGQEQGQEGPDGDKKDGKGKNKRGRTLKEILDEINRRKEEERRKAEQQGQKSKADGKGEDGESDGDGDEADGDPGGTEAGEGGEGRTLEEIAKSDWSNYPAIVAQLMGVILQVARVLQKIKDKQLQSDIRRSPELERIPEGLELDRLEGQAHKDLTVKKVTGQPVEESDLDRFLRDERYEKPAQIDVVLLIDGSGSMMTGWHHSKINALDASLLSATIIKEAAERVGANVYINMWGSYEPVTIARPGDDHRTIARNIVNARAGLNSGTSFAPSIRHITKEIAAHAGKGEPYRGYTHIIVFSDGDIYDESDSREALRALLGAVDHVTVDFAITEDRKSNPYNVAPKSSMERLADSLRAGNEAQRIGVVTGNDPATLPAQVIGMLLDKVSRSESFRAIPTGKKKNDFRRAHHRMEP